MSRPSAAFEFSVSPVTACLEGARLSSSAAILDWSKARSVFGFAGSGGLAACTGGSFTWDDLTVGDYRVTEGNKTGYIHLDDPEARAGFAMDLCRIVGI